MFYLLDCLKRLKFLNKYRVMCICDADAGDVYNGATRRRASVRFQARFKEVVIPSNKLRTRCKQTTSIKQTLKMDTKTNDNHKLQKPSTYNCSKISFCVLLLIILSSELFLGYYIQSSIISESNEKFVLKNELLDLFVNILNEEQVKNAIGLIVKEFDDGSANFEKFLNRRKRRAMAVDDNLVTSQKEQPNVEFFNPKLRHELEAKDEVERARTGNKGAAPGGDQWVWLTSYSRIPVNCMEFVNLSFCFDTKINIILIIKYPLYSGKKYELFISFSYHIYSIIHLLTCPPSEWAHVRELRIKEQKKIPTIFVY